MLSQAKHVSVPKTILIVEDNDLNMKLFHDLLEAHGYDILQTKDGMEALRLARQHHPDLILMDIQLPGRDGFALLREIRESPHSAVRVIALTAHAMSGDRERALDAGFDGYLTKPIDIRSFPGQVQRALRGESLEN